MTVAHVYTVVFQGIEAREVVVRRKLGASLARAFGLRDLDETFDADARLRILAINRIAIRVGVGPHQAVAHVGVMRNGQRLNPVGALMLDVAPEILGVGGIHRGKR